MTACVHSKAPAGDVHHPTDAFDRCPCFWGSPQKLKDGPLAVQPKELGQLPMTETGTSRRILVRQLGAGIKQRPAGGYVELLVTGCLKLPEDRQNVAGGYGVDLRRLHEDGSGLIVIQVHVTQAIQRAFEVEEVILKTVHDVIDQAIEINAAGVSALQNDGAAKGEVAANEHIDTGCNPHGEAFVVGIANADGASPFRAGRVLQGDHAKHFLLVSGQAELFAADAPAMPTDGVIHGIYDLDMRHRSPSHGRFRRGNQGQCVSVNEAFVVAE